MKQEIRFCHPPDGVRIAYAVSGMGPPLVRVANWLTHLNLDWDSPIWSHWFGEFSKGYSFVRYDPRGTGLSDRQISKISLEAWTQDLEAVVDDLGLERFNLLGFCQGGPIAVAYAASHPERVNRLVLYDAYAYGAFVEGVDPARKREAETLEEMIKVGWGRQTAAFRQVFTNLLIPSATTEQQHWFAEFERETVSAETAARLWRAFHQLDVRKQARQVKPPTLVLHVRGDSMVPFEAGLQLAALIPGSRFVPLEGNNHILLENEPAWPRFLAEVHSFIETRAGVPELRPITTQPVFPELTRREYEILELIAQGLTNKEISDHLVVAPKTARNHISNIYHKLNVSNRSQAVILAREAGLGHQDDER
jgi:pimeloyl-ACP methyl ester carboxylesterase/DNA-binding CsgD family transcriptional regulator